MAQQIIRGCSNKRCSQMQNKILYMKGRRPSGRRLSAFSEVSEDIYLELCCRDSFGSAGGLDLRADRGLSRQFLCPHGQYGRGTF